MMTPEEWKVHLDKCEARRREGYNGYVRRLKEVMTKDNVDVVFAAYSGENDEGWITDVAAWRRIDPSAQFPAELTSAHTEHGNAPEGFERVEVEQNRDHSEIYYDELREIVGELNPGFEINEGGCGHVVCNKLTGKITGDHGEYFVRTSWGDNRGRF